MPDVNMRSSDHARGRTIVVVDDDLDIRDSIAEILVNEGYGVLTAPNGLQLLTTLAEKKPDLILLDVMMPAVNGLDLCRALKRSPDFCDIPVVLMSAVGTPEDVLQATALGAAEYFKKPFDVNRLVARIDELTRPA
jgi:DNA-binding response OmpR family regulator